MPGGQGPPDDLLGLRDVEPALGLGAPAQRHVGEPDVVLRRGSAGSSIAGGHARKARPGRARTMTVMLATTQKPSTAPPEAAGSRRARTGAATA